jgi:hypothetical protein
MLSIQGIDKISIALQPIIVGKKLGKVPIDPKKELTFRYFGCFPVLDIHAERLDLDQDLHSQIASIIYELIEKDFINFPNTPLTFAFVHQHLDCFVLFLKEIEFFFDLRPDNISIDEKEDNPEIDDKEKLFYRYENTHYSKDRSKKNRKSKIAIYDRKLRLKETRQKSYKEIEAMSNNMRLEFRLCNSNCKYMDIDNIKGNYNKVFKNYLPYLASSYNKLAKDSLDITSREHANLLKLLDESSKDRVRARGNLKKGVDNRKEKMKKEQQRISRILNDFEEQSTTDEK